MEPAERPSPVEGECRIVVWVWLAAQAGGVSNPSWGLPR